MTEAIGAIELNVVEQPSVRSVLKAWGDFLHEGRQSREPDFYMEDENGTRTEYEIVSVELVRDGSIKCVVACEKTILIDTQIDVRYEFDAQGSEVSVVPKD